MGIKKPAIKNNQESVRPKNKEPKNKGVIWGGATTNCIINNANIAIKRLKNFGKNVFLVTNSSVRSQRCLIEKCKTLNIDIDKDQSLKELLMDPLWFRPGNKAAVITVEESNLAKKQKHQESAVCAPAILSQYLKNLNFKKKIYVIGTESFANELREGGFECVGPVEETLKFDNIYERVATETVGLDPRVGAVVVGFDEFFNYDKILKASWYLSDPDCLFLGNNIDVKYPVLGSKYSFAEAGVMIAAIEAASCRKATIIGKPSTLMFEVLASRHNLVPERTLMIGDTLETDILFGNRCGMKTLLVLSGVSTLKDVEKAKQENLDMVPHYYLPSLGDIIELIG